MSEKWMVKVPLPADWGLRVTTCSISTCRYYVAILSEYTHGCLRFENPKQHKEAVSELRQLIEKRVREKIRELGLPEPHEMRWEPGTCYCPQECLQLVAVYYTDTFQEGLETRRQFEKYYRTR
ncbi:MAG: hypothetical protein QXT37_09285 [Thermofilaceae archaeon]